MKQGTANLAEDYCFIHKALRPVSKARRQIAAVPPSNSRPASYQGIGVRAGSNYVIVIEIVIDYAKMV